MFAMQSHKFTSNKNERRRKKAKWRNVQYCCLPEPFGAPMRGLERTKRGKHHGPHTVCVDKWKQKRPGHRVSGAEQNIIARMFSVFYSFSLLILVFGFFDSGICTCTQNTGWRNVDMRFVCVGRAVLECGLLCSANGGYEGVWTGSCWPCGHAVLFSQKRIVKTVNTTIFCSVLFSYHLFANFSFQIQISSILRLPEDKWGSIRVD